MKEKEVIDKNTLKLIYVLKIGKNAKGEGVYEFLFSKTPEHIDVKGWNWDASPAVNYKEDTVPSEDYVDETYSLVTKDFELICLHDAIDRPYIHGYHHIHCLAYEDFDGEISSDDFSDNYEDFYENTDDKTVLVFHYNESLQSIEDKLYERNIILKNGKFLSSKAIKY